VAQLAESVAALYDVFAGYPRPRDPWICPQCAPGLTGAELARVPLRSLSFGHLDAVHVMSLDDDALRHYIPRLFELLLLTPAPVFDFRVADLKDRAAGWTEAERSAVGLFGDAVWAELIDCHPVELGYFSDCQSAVDLLDWCGLALPERLDGLMSGPAAARHLADLVDAVFTVAAPFETASKASVLAWVETPAVGERLQGAFFSATGQAAQQLSAAHELWTVCVRS
jgi:hypothetical protein